MKNKPIIGIIGKVQPKEDFDFWHRIDEVDEFRYYIVKKGGIAIILLPSQKTINFNNNDIKDDTILTKEELEDLYRQINLCDGFILQGGLVSCSYEVEMAKKIIELDKPLLGICAGFNNILRALGTDVVEDKTNSHNFYEKGYRHNIKIEKHSIIYDIIKKEEYSVNSIHSMIAKKEMLKDYVKISSYSLDNLVESFELENKNFVVGIKWHPEIMDDEFMDKLFELFLKKCKKS